MATAGKIKKLFARRDEIYGKYTVAIKDALTPTLLSAIVELLELREDDRSRLVWNHIQLQAGGFITLSGMVLYKEGDTIIADDKTEVNLTKDMAYAFTKLIRFVLPIDIVENASKTDIMQYLKALENQYKEEYKNIYGGDPTLKNINLDEIEGDTIEEKLQNATALRQADNHHLTLDAKLDGDDGFVYSDLTEEQQEALRLSRLTQAGNTGKVN